jgi:hypothetical protein
LRNYVYFSMISLNIISFSLFNFSLITFSISLVIIRLFNKSFMFCNLLLIPLSIACKFSCSFSRLSKQILRKFYSFVWLCNPLFASSLPIVFFFDDSMFGLFYFIYGIYKVEFKIKKKKLTFLEVSRLDKIFPDEQKIMD